MPQKRTFKEVVDIMAEVAEILIQYVPVSIEQFKAGMRNAGLPDSYVWLFGYLFKEVIGNPANQEVSNDVAKVLNRPAKDFETYAKQTAATGIWNHVSINLI